MILIEDQGQKENQHIIKHNYWAAQGVEIIRQPLPIGDYVIGDDKVMEVIERKKARGVRTKKMDFIGSYKACVDTKKDIYELVDDICGKDHERFRDECILAQNNGVQLYVLVENQFEYIDRGKNVYNDIIYELKDLHKWINRRLWIRDKTGKPKFPRATKGITIQKACMTLERKYGVKFIFCSTREAGYVTVRLLVTGGK